MSSTGLYPNTRLRRLRGSATIRALVEEREVNVSKLVLPLFIKHGANIKNPISSMPGHFQLSIDNRFFYSEFLTAKTQKAAKAFLIRASYRGQFPSLKALRLIY
jgi:delta-aminolevulinic acid dehydratase/porphobilinogen synthase